MIHKKQEGVIAWLTIDRPPANALSQALLDDLDTALTELKTDRSVKVVVIRGEGKFFVAGADIKEFSSLPSGEEFSRFSKKGQAIFNLMEDYPKPIIAAMHGAALGGGLELALGCHIRLATTDAKLGLPEANLGIIPAYGGTQRLPQVVGSNKAMEMMLTGEPISGEEAYRFGLVNAVAEDEAGLRKQAERLAKSVASKSINSIEAILELVPLAREASRDHGLEREAALSGKVFDTVDRQEGVQAFIDKRKPEFKDQ
ncbi:enoyl-CoA hydratase [Geomicrobium halophilum]|uniref:Enoyl-CoA hydratase n=1 Tax=Geomicrobium halophilum TaxID=549000 RepID=A0A841PHD0_9BACL|nr:enoyl-CoA hydratase [Geomicrobium halophilum]MBB6448297.1 enoyl-CoA hydratase [Geomicrobium halophilum]